MSVEMTPDENEIARAQQDDEELRSIWLAKLDELHESAKDMVRRFGFRQVTGPIPEENGAKLVTSYGAYVGRALRQWSRSEVRPLLETIKKEVR